jgi:transcriptional regulator with XRE-family HTH domain
VLVLGATGAVLSEQFMHARMESPTYGYCGSPQRYRVGAELRRVRENLGWSGERVADSLQWSQSKVSRIETGATAFAVRDVDRLLGLYGVDPDIRAELLAATAEENGEGPWTRVPAAGDGDREQSRRWSRQRGRSGSISRS